MRGIRIREWGDGARAGEIQPTHLSSVFKWFAGDFASEGGVIVFVTRYASQDDARWLSAHAADVSIEYLDYDWGLNDLERRGEPPVAAEGNWR